MAIHRYVTAHCPRCDKDVDFQIEMCLVDYNGIIPCLRCPSCNTIVPNYSFSRYLETGKVIIGM